jgi:hypothetical protein
LRVLFSGVLFKFDRNRIREKENVWQRVQPPVLLLPSYFQMRVEEEEGRGFKLHRNIAPPPYHHSNPEPPTVSYCARKDFLWRK